MERCRHDCENRQFCHPRRSDALGLGGVNDRRTAHRSLSRARTTVVRQQAREHGKADIPSSQLLFFRPENINRQKWHGVQSHGLSLSPGASGLAKRPFGARASHTKHTCKLKIVRSLDSYSTRSDDIHDIPDVRQPTLRVILSTSLLCPLLLREIRHNAFGTRSQT